MTTVMTVMTYDDARDDATMMILLLLRSRVLNGRVMTQWSGRETY